MRGLGIALIVVGLLGSVLIFLYPCLGWSGLVGAVASIMTGIGFLASKELNA